MEPLSRKPYRGGRRNRAAGLCRSQETAVSNAEYPRFHCRSGLASRSRQLHGPRVERTSGSYVKNFHDLITHVIDHLHGNTALRWLVERTRCIAVQRCPGFEIDLRFQGRFQCIVGIVRTEELGMADEEAKICAPKIRRPQATYVLL